MQSEYRNSNHHVNSISDLYISDEISILLEEIQSLEPSSYRVEDIQDFEIAGSQTGGMGGGGRTASSVAEIETPGDITIHSWDSHANYKHHIHGSSPTQSFFTGIMIYFDRSQLKSNVGLLRLFLILTVLLVLLCICTAGIFRVPILLLPLVGRIRFMLFVSLLTLLITCTILFLDVTHLIYLFPLNWGKINAVMYVTISILFLMSSSLNIHQVFAYWDYYIWVPESTSTHILVTGGLGYLCALEALLLALMARCDEGQYKPVNEEHGSITLHERRDVVRYTPSPCPSLQPAVITPHWISQDNNFLLPTSRTREAVST